MKLLYTSCLVLFSVLPIFPQAEPVATQDFPQVEKVLTKYKPEAALPLIDSLLVSKNFSEAELTLLKSLKVEALQQAELFDEAIQLSEEVLASPDLKDQNRLRVRLQRAVIYEIIGNLDTTEEELNKASELLKHEKLKSTEFYGFYLIRKSSFHRMAGRDSLAYDLARRARAFGDSASFPQISAPANMLMGFLTKKSDAEQETAFYKKALKTWKEIGDQNGVTAMYSALARVQGQQDDFTRSHTYLDSALTVAVKRNDFYTLATANETKSELFERKSQFDSALHYLKLFKKYDDRYGLAQKELAINQLDFRSEVEKEIIRRDAVFADLQNAKTYNTTLGILAAILLFSLFAVGYLVYRLIRKNRQVVVQKDVIETSNTELKTLIGEKQLLLKELHHRVKNNLSMILSLMSFQKKEIQNPVYKDKLEVLNNRINAVAIVHQQLWNEEDGILGHSQNIRNYVDKIAQSLIGLSNRTVNYEPDIEAILLPLDTAVPIGMLINELVSNSLKHAEPKVDGLVISIILKNTVNGPLLTYGDNGKKTTRNIENEGLGVFIIDNMVEQLNAKLDRDNWHYTIQIPPKPNGA